LSDPPSSFQVEAHLVTVEVFVLNLRDKRKPRSADAETTKQWEVKGLSVEFEASGLEFCRDRGMALSTLRRHLKKHSPGGGRAKPRYAILKIDYSRPALGPHENNGRRKPCSW
jgi:hypothetical protein